MNHPAVSVLLPVYNASEFLREALDSLIVQTFEDFEVIAVDDGSTDDSLEILREYAQRDHRFRVLSRPNTGIVGALNDGLAVARAPLIARMDADDISRPERFARQVAFMNEHKQVIALGTWVAMTWVNGLPIYTYRTPPKHQEIAHQLLIGNGGAIIHPSAVFRREALEVGGGYREKALWYEDFDLYLRLLECGELANLPEVLLDYRQHLKSVNQSEKARLSRQGKQATLNHYRQGQGLPSIGASALSGSRENPNVDPRTEALEQWIGLAMGEGNIQTARTLTRNLVRFRPFAVHSWKLMRYVYGKTPGHPSERAVKK